MSFSLNGIFTSHAVLPHGKPFKIYGSGEGEVAVTLNGAEVKTFSTDGKWSVTMPQMECGGPYELKAFCGEKTVVLDDIFIGEVILICGQSNMQFKLCETSDSPDSYQSNDKLRLFTVDRPEEGETFKTEDGWVKCNKSTAGDWSAIGYYVACEMNRVSGIAVGLIACYQGASMIQSWLPKTVAEREELNVPIKNRHRDYYSYPIWNGDGFLYETMLKNVLPYSFNRMVFYQGESNTTEAEGEVYDKFLKAFIETVRNGVSDSILPVTIVQIADYDARNDEDWKAVQTAQLRVAQLCENVSTVISADICESDHIHPPTKKPLAVRIVKSFG